MIPQHVLVGGVIIVLCAVLLARERWFLETTSKGQRLIRWFGGDLALWVLRGLILSAIAFGALLAAGIIRPIQW